MANASKNSWLVIVLVVAGAAVLIYGLVAKPKEQAKGVELSELANQTPPVAASSSSKEPSSIIKDPVVSPAIVADTSDDQGHQHGFAVQVYSFQDKNRAEKALTDLLEKKYQAFIVMSDLGEKGTWYRVRVGGIDNDIQAQKMLEELRKVYKSGFIVKPKV